MKRRRTELIHEGGYAAQVDVKFDYDEESWSPTMSPDDARKLERVKLALRRGDFAEPPRTPACSS